jgi:lysophospholipase L1-like esterase
MIHLRNRLDVSSEGTAPRTCPVVALRYAGGLLCLLLLAGCAGPKSGAHISVPSVPNDYQSEPFHRVVVMGESTVEGGGWLQGKEERYADRLVRLINEAQGEPVEYFNKGIGANAISPRSPGYPQSRKPSALERYQKDVIANRPDLFVLAYGLNDMRAGMNLGDFIADLEKIVREVQAACHPVIVLVGVYHMPRYDWYPPYDRGCVAATLKFNQAIYALAERTGCLYADAYHAEGRADWVVHQDSVHANRVGNILIANEIFQVLATHCSGLAKTVNHQNEDTKWTRQTRANRYGPNRPNR